MEVDKDKFCEINIEWKTDHDSVNNNNIINCGGS